jgi:hypothetical protein
VNDQYKSKSQEILTFFSDAKKFSENFQKIFLNQLKKNDSVN